MAGPKLKGLYGGMPGRDILNIPGHAIEVKATTTFLPLEWMRQAAGYIKDDERPCAIWRMNGQGENADNYYIMRYVEDDELRGQAWNLHRREFKPKRWLSDQLVATRAGRRPYAAVTMLDGTVIIFRRLIDDELNKTRIL